MFFYTDTAYSVDMYNPEADIVTLEDIYKARELLNGSFHCRRTPLLHHVQKHFSIDSNVDLYLKMESMQVQGDRYLTASDMIEVFYCYCC